MLQIRSQCGRFILRSCLCAPGDGSSVLGNQHGSLGTHRAADRAVNGNRSLNRSPSSASSHPNTSLSKVRGNGLTEGDYPQADSGNSLLGSRPCNLALWTGTDRSVERHRVELRSTRFPGSTGVPCQRSGKVSFQRSSRGVRHVSGSARGDYGDRDCRVAARSNRGCPYDLKNRRGYRSDFLFFAKRWWDVRTL